MEFKKIQSYTFIVLLISVTLLFLWILRPYIYPIFWAIVIAVLFHPIYISILKKCNYKKSLASYLTLALIILILLIPLSAITSLVVQQAVSIYQQYGNEATYNNMASNVQNYLESPLVQHFLGGIDIQQKLVSWGADISGFIYSFVASSGQGTAKFLVQFFIMLYTLFFFLREGDVILKKFMHLLPLGDKYEKHLYNRFVSTARATLKGTLLIGLIQGTMGGLALFIAGVPGSAFWGLVMVLLCVIPSLGAAIILAPAALILLLIGNIWQAVVVIVFMVVASLIDNILRGPLVGKDAQMHPLFIFFATLGGLLTFGITGVIIGPVITAFLLSMWEIYEEKYKIELSRAD